MPKNPRAVSVTINDAAFEIAPLTLRQSEDLMIAREKRAADQKASGEEQTSGWLRFNVQYSIVPSLNNAQREVKDDGSLAPIPDPAPFTVDSVLDHSALTLEAVGQLTAKINEINGIKAPEKPTPGETEAAAARPVN